MPKWPRQSGRLEETSASMIAPCLPCSMPPMLVPERARREARSSGAAVTSTKSLSQLQTIFIGEVRKPTVDSWQSTAVGGDPGHFDEVGCMKLASRCFAYARRIG